jgi:hypothetical protein
MSENWVDGTYESGADDDPDTPNEPVERGGSDEFVEGTGVEIGIDEGSTFEPEEDVDAP